ncbi:hypothetical protein P0Y31_11525 [Knoellia sp. 3-2P3]|uniref:hypothetical protein n=1 Tax=unclassified Knoellia TaxID=2618719 RepID=UPI0023DB9CA2|nr:hypothetical protein [Knoellia sp. 3-2P3]MDF2092973.1 hypothetical protein [Knoellia sp. 3-2P3]
MGQAGGRGTGWKHGRAGGALRRRLPVVVLLLLLALWPLTYLYSSVGLDVDTVGEGRVDTRMWRVRWPGDGTVRVGWIDEHRSGDANATGGVDLGALVLQPARPPTPRTEANRWGFWWEDVVASRGDRPSGAAPRADRVMLVGAPHWALVLGALALVVATARRSARERRRRGPWRGGIRATAG